MYIAQKVQLRLNKKAEIEFLKNFGYKRWIFNKGLEKWNKMYNHYKLHNFRDKAKKTNDKNLKKFYRSHYPKHFSVRELIRPYTKTSWRKDRPSMIFETAMEDLSYAFNNFIKHGISDRPNFKSKHNSKQSCRYYRKDSSSIKFNGRKMKLVKTPEVTLLEDIKFDGTVKEVTISKEIDKWYASLVIDTGDSRPKTVPHKRGDMVGVDLGVRELAVFSDSNGELFEETSNLVHDLETLYNRTKKYNQIMSRKQKGSRNYNDTRTKYQKTWRKIRNKRKDVIDKLTSYLVKNYKYIVIEDLNVRGMISGKSTSRHKLRDSIAKSCFGEIRRQLEYKQHIFNSEVIVVSRWFPSTQLCSSCGTQRNKIGGKKTYSCSCGFKIDRDTNAAINLLNEGQRILRESHSLEV